MTSYYYWFKSYSLYKRAIWLADNSVIFEPIVKGKWIQLVKFSQVLYIPNLRSNLLSCFYLICNKNFEIYILLHIMSFRPKESILFMATIDYTNLAILNRTIIILETALSISTISANLSLWYYIKILLREVVLEQNSLWADIHN